MLQPGDQAPLDIEISDHDGNPFRLRDVLGQQTIIYFYPKDNTPGCSAQACSIRDSWSALQAKGVQLYGVSADSPQSHQRFIEKKQLPFPLLSDPEKKLCEAFGAWGEKKIFGKISLGIKRMSFILDKEGKVLDVIEKVKTKEHARQLLDALEAREGS
ncbi:thioredoxin-dependent thiol peroxidase [Desulfurispira natronophila]|uniref:thioredoxin-dependent peroxiredoxin n=1 Tax=Desulfurispira natronophila TaxID=682562 RepID=A0A7W7Y268_9BACT|nr:thioredoxin-dependent thiol peroxidase [Desulfurispira natronophila]MBB5020706.1 peroxiredoxin Q/BCP [Desulfurispira natronophila]